MDQSTHFYIELKPIHDKLTAEAVAVHGLDLQNLAAYGVAPHTAMHRFRDWIHECTPDNHRPVFIGFNAPFDWMFVNDYFHRFIGGNPFGHAAIDIRSYYMGLRQIKTGRASLKLIAREFGKTEPLTHNALDDAIYQAQLFEAMLNEISSN